MRIVALADTHLFTDDDAFARSGVPDGDVLLHVGDALRAGDEDELAHFAAFVRALPHATKIFVPGNHDVLFERDRARAQALLGDDVVVLIDESIVVDGVRFFGAPWTPTFHDWAFMRDDGAPLAQCFARIPDDVHVLATHGPPAGILDRSTTHPLGSRALMDRVLAVRPALHVFGHIHGARGVVEQDGVVFANVSTNECDHPPMVFELDVASRRVTPIAR